MSVSFSTVRERGPVCANQVSTSDYSRDLKKCNLDPFYQMKVDFCLRCFTFVMPLCIYSSYLSVSTPRISLSLLLQVHGSRVTDT